MKAFWKDPVAIAFAVFGAMMPCLLIMAGPQDPNGFSNSPWDASIGLLAHTALNVMGPSLYGASWLFDRLPFRNSSMMIPLLVFGLAGGLASYFLLGKIISLLLRWLTKDKNTLRYRLLNDPIRTAVLFLLFEGAIPVAHTHILFTLMLEKSVALTFVAILQTAAFFMLGAFVLALTRSRNKEKLNKQGPSLLRHPRESGDPGSANPA